jgi:phospholipid/cholesterol/gamma-HCH transport system substrate-binding protein
VIRLPNKSGAAPSLAEQKLIRVGAIGLIVTVMVILAAQFYEKAPYLNAGALYTGLFADSSGLVVGDKVVVAGVDAGTVQAIELDGERVEIKFTADKLSLGDQTELAIKTKTLLGNKYLQVTSRGDGKLKPTDEIPVSRTRSAYLLTDSLNDLTNTISGLDTDQVTQSLGVLSDTFDRIAPNLGSALDGVGRFSQSIGSRDDLLRDLFGHAEKVTGVLAARSDQLQQLVVDGDQLLGALDQRRAAMDVLLTNVTAVSRQVEGLIDDNKAQLTPVLEQLQQLTGLLEKHKNDLSNSIVPLSQYATSLGESVASGPFFKAYVMNLLPGQFLQPFIDAAFKKRGIDPAALNNAMTSAGAPQTGGTP